jgi:hypothetical protein
MVFPAMGGHVRAAVRTCLATVWVTASLDIGVPLRVLNSGSPGAVLRVASQAVRIFVVWLVSGVQRSLRPLPWQ